MTALDATLTLADALISQLTDQRDRARFDRDAARRAVTYKTATVNALTDEVARLRKLVEAKWWAPNGPEQTLLREERPR